MCIPTSQRLPNAVRNDANATTEVAEVFEFAVADVVDIKYPELCEYLYVNCLRDYLIVKTFHIIAFEVACKFVKYYLNVQLVLFLSLPLFSPSLSCTHSLSLVLCTYDVGACWKTSSSGLVLLLMLPSRSFSLTPHEHSVWFTAFNVTISRGWWCSSETLRRYEHFGLAAGVAVWREKNVKWVNNDKIWTWARLLKCNKMHEMNIDVDFVMLSQMSDYWLEYINYGECKGLSEYIVNKLMTMTLTRTIFEWLVLYWSQIRNASFNLCNDSCCKLCHRMWHFSRNKKV